MGTVANIYRALNTRLLDMPGRPAAVAWSNIKYVPVRGVNYLRPTLMPAGTDLSSLDGVQEFRGIYQIDIFVSLDNGTNDFSTIADSLIDYFKAEKRLTANDDVIFIQAVGLGMPVREESWYHGYIEVNYLCYS